MDLLPEEDGIIDLTTEAGITELLRENNTILREIHVLVQALVGLVEAVKTIARFLGWITTLVTTGFGLFQIFKSHKGG